MTTKSGFDAVVDPRILSDWRFTMAISKTNSKSDLDKLAGVQEMATLLLGEEQFARLMAHIAEKNDGFVPSEIVVTEVREILDSVKEIKN